MMRRVRRVLFIMEEVFKVVFCCIDMLVREIIGEKRLLFNEGFTVILVIEFKNRKV